MFKTANDSNQHVICQIVMLFWLMVFPSGNESLHAQIYFHDDSPVISLEKLDSLRSDMYQLMDSLSSVHYHMGKFDLFEINEKTHAIPDGYFDVFLYENRRWKNLYNGVFGEYNFGSSKFVHNNTIYSYGGYGHWNKNHTIIEFLSQNGEWELLKFSEILPYGAASTTKNGICIYAGKENVHVDVTKGTFEILQPKNIKIRWPENSQYFAENEHWLVCTDSLYTYCISKKSGGKYTLIKKTTPLQHVLKTDLIHITNDSLVVYAKDGNRKVFDIESAIKNAITTTPEPNIWLKMLGGGIFLISIFLFLNYQKKRTRNEGNVRMRLSPKFEGSVISIVVPYSGQTIDTQKLDELLGIQDEANADTRKYRRSQIIKEINDIYLAETGSWLIERERDQLDGRKYVYKIL